MPGFCTTCGAGLNTGSAFCGACGTAVAPAPQPVSISRDDAKLIALENQRARGSGNIGVILWIVGAILIAALVQTIWGGVSMILAGVIGLLVALVPSMLITNRLMR